jgi:hypothetical protein
MPRSFLLNESIELYSLFIDIETLFSYLGSSLLLFSLYRHLNRLKKTQKKKILTHWTKNQKRKKTERRKESQIRRKESQTRRGLVYSFMLMTSTLRENIERTIKALILGLNPWTKKSLKSSLVSRILRAA